MSDVNANEMKTRSFTIRLTPEDQAALAELCELYGLDQPIPVQYLRYMGNLLRGNLGDSYYFKRPVSDLLLEKYKRLLGEIEETENQLKSELAAALAHHFGPEAMAE